MHHGTLMFASDLSVVADVLNVSSDKFHSKATKSVKSRVTNIAPYLTSPLSLEQFKALIIKHIMKTDQAEPYVFSAQDLAMIQKIKEERYDTCLLYTSYQSTGNGYCSRLRRYGHPVS